jgi:hypothetical protein
MVLYQVQISGRNLTNDPIKNTRSTSSTVENCSDISCLDDQSCIVTWIIESDDGSPISRAEISYAKVDLFIYENHLLFLLYFKVSGVNVVEQWSPAIQIEPLTLKIKRNN